MSGNDFVLDTNAVLYILNGDQVLSEFLYRKRLHVSVITEMELLSYHGLTETSRQQVEDFLSSFEVIGLFRQVQLAAIEVRKSTRLKLPDSIIAATAISLGLPFVSSDKQFKTVAGLDLLLYER